MPLCNHLSKPIMVLLQQQLSDVQHRFRELNGQDTKDAAQFSRLPPT
jgi:hypothetical protein